MINQVHQNSIIGIKRLTSSDLGTADNGVTHIGLFNNTLNFLNFEEHQVVVSQLIYENRTYDLLSLLDYIQREDGRFDAPKIRKGHERELFIGNTQINSVVREIRDISENEVAQNWYLLWLGLDSNELVFLLFKESSDDFNAIENIVGAIGGRKMQIGNTKREFRPLVSYLNSKVNNVNLEYYNELEEATQTGTEKTTRRIIPRPKDLERANKIFKAIGEEGERLLFQYLESEKRQSNIRDFKWLNQSREMYEPYDFEIIQNNGNTIFSDAKATNKNFEDYRPIYLSSNELSFINDNKDNYLIHRLYSIGEEPKMRICDNIHTVSDIFIPNFNAFNRALNTERLSIQGIKLAVPTNLDILNFENEILLNANA
tara:strand:- start:875 stop:1990 length:1116 start_codon:yes stop_codon:yes gene_type:complete